MGDALVPYAERVDAALKKVLASRPWKDPQRKWLERIGKQLKLETVVDREALDQGAFQRDGGFKKIDKVFDGALEDVLSDLRGEIWKTRVDPGMDRAGSLFRCWYRGHTGG